MKLKLIAGWRDGWRLWSVRLAALGALLSAAAIAAPDMILAAWNAMPDELRAYLPERTGQILSVMIYAAAVVARLVKQETPGGE